MVGWSCWSSRPRSLTPATASEHWQQRTSRHPALAPTRSASDQVRKRTLNRSATSSAKPNRPRGALPTNPAPARLGTARQRRRSGASRTGKPGPKNRVKDEAPPLARRRVGSGLSVFVALSFLACGGGVSFRSLAPAVHVPVRFVSGSFRFWHLRCPLAVRVLFGVVSFARRGACRCVGVLRRRGPSGIICGASALRSGAAANTRRGRRDQRGALSPRSDRVSFRATLSFITHQGLTHLAWLSQGDGPVQPGLGCPRQGALGRHPQREFHSHPTRGQLCRGQPVGPLQRSWGFEHPRQGQHLRCKGLPPQVTASLLPQAQQQKDIFECPHTSLPTGHHHPFVSLSPRRHHAAAHTTRRTIRGTRTHHQ